MAIGSDIVAKAMKHEGVTDFSTSAGSESKPRGVTKYSRNFSRL